MRDSVGLRELTGKSVVAGVGRDDAVHEVGVEVPYPLSAAKSMICVDNSDAIALCSFGSCAAAAASAA